jgi:signal transduction histidine kinase/ActR/RegA family two-component response regulator
MNLPDIPASILVPDIRRNSPEMICVILSPQDRLDDAFALIGKGAYSVLRTPARNDELLAVTRQAFDALSLRAGKEAAEDSLEAMSREFEAADARLRLLVDSAREANERYRAQKRQEEAARRRLESQLLQSQKLESIGRLAGGIAHDFNNLLSAILGYCEIALIRLPENHPIADNLRMVRQAGDRAASLTRQLLAFSRKQVMEMKVVNPNVVVDNMGKMLGRLIGEDIELVLKTDTPVRNIFADPAQIEQVLMNLAVNARDAMPGGGSLTIETSDVSSSECVSDAEDGFATNPYVRISISDTGEGMTPEVRESIFEPFFTTKDVGKGTGLGLAMVYGIVKQHNGCITVDSEPGMGATFDIYLPVASVGPEEVVDSELESIRRGTETIMVVDDEPSIRELFLDALAPLGYRVITAGSGSEAIEKLKTTAGVDLLITDIVMPGMSGGELGEMLGKLYPLTSVVYMTGYIESAMPVGNHLGAAAVLLHKPLTFSAIASVLSRVLDRRKAWREDDE